MTIDDILRFKTFLETNTLYKDDIVLRLTRKQLKDMKKGKADFIKDNINLILNTGEGMILGFSVITEKGI